MIRERRKQSGRGREAETRRAGGTEGDAPGWKEESRFDSGGDDKQLERTNGGRRGRASEAFVSSSRGLRGATRVPMSPRPPGARASLSL